MKFTYFSFLLVYLLFNNTKVPAQDLSNPELAKMAEADQRDRMNGPIDWNKLNREDSIRRAAVMDMIKSGKVQTAKDHLNAGIIFQHGNDTVASAMAVKNFEIAIRMDSSLNRWWYAAAVDRDRMRRKLPQIYGTQFIRDKKEGKWKRYTLDSTAVNDQQRKYYRVETLAEQREKEWKMNLKPIADTYKENNSIEKTIASIRQQHRLGRLSAYSLEAEINTFGYSLLRQNKKEEALKIFKLNTELYPDAFNTFDSYGELLMTIGKKKQALKAYKKSLQLNPENENARKILSANR